MSVLTCSVLHNICIEKMIASTAAWISLLTKITTKENRPKILEETLKMVSDLNTADTFKGEYRLEIIFMNIYGLRNNIMRTIRMGSFDIVMKLVVCKICLICLILVYGKAKKLFMNSFYI